MEVVKTREHTIIIKGVKTGSSRLPKLSEL